VYNLQSNVLEPTFRSLGYSEDQAEQLAALSRKKYVDVTYWAVFEDVVPVLSDLSDEGWTHVIVSNHVPELQDIVTHLGLSRYILEIINSSLYGYEKPHPQIYRHALERAGNPEQRVSRSLVPSSLEGLHIKCLPPNFKV